MSRASLGTGGKSGLTLRILEKFFSFPAMIAGLLAMVAVIVARTHLNDPDMWWHLKMGQVIWTSHTIPLTDLFSWTTNHHAIIPQEWLAELSIFAAYHLNGYTGLMLWLGLLAALVAIGGYGLCVLYSGNAKVSLLGGIIVLLFITIGLTIRPQMLSYLLVTIELLLIQLGRTRNPRWFYGLPPLFALWINCHASYLLGLIIAAVYLACSYFSFEAGSLAARRWERSRRNPLIVALLLAVPALLLNPAGYRAVLYPLDTMLNMPLLFRYVDEWTPLKMTDARAIAMMAILLCIFLLVMVRHSTLFLEELVLLSLSTWLAVSHQRMLFIFGMLAAPILMRLLADLWENYDPEKDRMMPNAVMLGIALAVMIAIFPSRQDLEKQVDSQMTPVRAVQFMKAHHLVGPMLNDYVFGGYLIWAAPEYPVFIDGRTDLYEWSGTFDQFIQWTTLQNPPNELLDKYGVNVCLLYSRSPMVRVLPLLGNWKVVYSDDRSVIFTRTH